MKTVSGSRSFFFFSFFISSLFLSLFLSLLTNKNKSTMTYQRGLCVSLLVLVVFQSLSCFALLSSPTTTSTSTKNINFEDWIADAPHEVTEWKSLQKNVDGIIPDYVQGTFIRNGGGIWTGKDDEMYGHMFDGLAKIHSYRISSSSDEEEDDMMVEYQARFLQGSWYKEYQQSNKQLPAGIGTGPVLDSYKKPKMGTKQIIKAIMNVATKFDNTPVNIWDYQPNKGDSGGVVAALTDAPPRTMIDLESMDTLSTSTMNPLAKGARGYELLITAHPLYSQTGSGSTYNVAVEIGLGNPKINLIQETPSSKERTVISSFESDNGVPYLHSFGLSKNYAIIVLQPLRLDYDMNKLLEVGFLRAMEQVDKTRIVIIELSSGDVVLDQSIDEKIYFYHSISTAEEVNDDTMTTTTVSLRLCGYKEPDQLTGENQFLRMDQAKKGLEFRNKLHKGGKFVDIECNIQDKTVNVKWNDKIQQGFELPITRYSRVHDGIVPSSSSTTKKKNGGGGQSHPRYVYSFGAYALGSSDYDSFGLFKFDLEENKVVSYYQQPSVYLTEPAFIANPNGTREDDGVLLCEAYFGEDQETKVLVIDATTMNVLAEIKTGNRAPFGFHGAWIPSN